MKRIVTFVCMVLIASALNAQDYDTLNEPVTIPRYHFGFGIGTGQPFIKELERNIEHYDASIMDTIDHVSYMGISSPYLNIIFEFDICKHLSLRFSPGFNLNKYVIYHHWQNGDKTTSTNLVNLVRVPLHANIKFPFKKNSFTILPGISYLNGNNSSVGVGLVKPVKSMALESGIEFTHDFNKLIVGIEIRYIHVIDHMDVYRLIGNARFADRIQMNYLQFGLTLKY
jgi:hypothetical protein